MKRIALALIFSAFVGIVRASEVDQLIGDTKEVLGKHYEVSYGFDFNGSENKEKLGLGSQVVAWRVLAIQPMLTYAPNASNSKVNFELGFPLRLGRLPIGPNKELRDLFPKTSSGGWLEKLGGGFIVRWNVTDDGIRVGWRLAFGNGK